MSRLKIVLILLIVMTVTVHSQHECPTWFIWNSTSSQCECGHQQSKLLECDQTLSKIMIAAGFCLTYTTEQEHFGSCSYNVHSPLLNFFTVPANASHLNEKMCGPLNRTGLLCSECQPGLGPVVFSYSRECKKCMEQPWGWILFFVRLTVPLTMFCMIVIIFRINIVSPWLVMLVFIAQIVSSSLHNNPFFVTHGINGDVTRLFAKFVLDLYGLFTLDFFLYLIPSFCIQEDMSMTTVVALEYFVALYPIFFTVLVYVCITLHDNGCKVLVICWRPIHKCLVKFRRKWNLKGSVVNAFVTFILLSYTKVCSISLQLIQPVAIWDKYGNTTYRQYFDAEISPNSPQYILLATLGIVTLIPMVMLPVFLLLLYQNPFFQKCLTMCKIKFRLVHELANITQACYKNGTSPGTRDCRWFAGVCLLLRIIAIFALNQRYHNLMYITLAGFMCLLTATIQPYRVYWYSVFDSFMWFLATMGLSWYVYFNAYGIHSVETINILGCIPLVYMLFIVCWKVTVKIAQCCRARHVENQVSLNTSDEETLPHRLLKPNKYSPLLPYYARN